MLPALVAVLAAAGATVPWWFRAVTTPGAPRPAASGTRDAVGLVRHLAFTWLPAGYRAWAYSLDTDRESLSAAPDPGAQVDPNSSVQLTAYHPGVAPAPDARDPHPAWIDATAADRVDRQPTQWTGLDGGRTSADIRVRWRYAPGSWAVLEYTGPDGADNLAAAVRVAAATRFDRATPVRLPVRVPGLPPALRLQAVDGHDPGPPDQWSVTLTYATAGRPADPNTAYQALTVDVQAMNGGLRTAMADPALGATTTVDGHPARIDLQRQPGSGYLDEVQVWDVAGLRIAVSIAGQQVRDLLGTDALGIYHRLRSSPSPSAPS